MQVLGIGYETMLRVYTIASISYGADLAQHRLEIVVLYKTLKKAGRKSAIRLPAQYICPGKRVREKSHGFP
jgi:hypothetical protein